MKNSLVLIFIVAFVQNALCQDVTLTGNTLKEYESQKITIEIKDKKIESCENVLISETPKECKKWQAYQGSKLLSEEEFFVLMDYMSEARMANKYKSTTSTEVICGGIATVIGVALAVTALNEKNKNEETKASPGLGILVTLIGGVVLGDGLGRKSKNWASCSVACELADGYNKELVVKLNKDF